MSGGEPGLQSSQPHGLVELDIALPMLGAIDARFTLPNSVADIFDRWENVVVVGVVDGEAPVAGTSHWNEEGRNGTLERSGQGNTKPAHLERRLNPPSRGFRTLGCS